MHCRYFLPVCGDLVGIMFGIAMNLQITFKETDILKILSFSIHDDNIAIYLNLLCIL